MPSDADSTTDQPTYRCPCCGGEIDKPIDLPRVLDSSGSFTSAAGPFRLTGQQANIFTLLLRHFPAIVTFNELCESLWGDIDEPDSAAQSLRVRFNQLRKALTSSGYTIENINGRGARLLRSSDPR